MQLVLGRVTRCRREGNSATSEAMNRFSGIRGMPTAPSTYWNDVHGFTAEDARADVEGVETVRNTATVWMSAEDLVRIVESHGNQVHVVDI